jgi:transcriptional regulator with XRE-family HTH domain
MAGSAETQRLIELLRAKIRDSGLSQREVARRLGSQADYVSQLLRGNLDLKLRQVYEILSVVGIPPAAFFAELHPVLALEGARPEGDESGTAASRQQRGPKRQHGGERAAAGSKRRGGKAGPGSGGAGR